MNIPLTIADTQKGLLKKEFSCVELVDSYLARISKYDKDLNSFITVTDELAYSKAKIVDKIIKQLGNDAVIKHQLLGVVVSYKDIFLTKNIRTTAASKVLEGYFPVYSATVVKKLDEAGCITIGKTNCDAWAHGSSGENSDFGLTKNPWNKNYVPGGSSSGSAVAVAANFSLISTGTDTCGSIRLPANYCGIYGLKPTYGSVSRYGIIAMASSLDSIGHFAHCIDDLSTVYKIVKGRDGNDSTLSNDEVKNKKGKFKIGIPKEFFVKGIDKEVKKTLTNAIKLFEEQNNKIVEISLPHTKYALAVYYIIQPAEVSSNLSRFDGIRYGSKRDLFQDEAKRRIMLGTYVLSKGYYDAYYLKAMKVRSIIKKEVDEAFNKVDAILAPVTPTPAFKIGEKASDPLQMYLTDIFAATANLSGIPALAIPYGFSKEGLPLGFQLMGPRFSEKIIFNLAKIYEEALNYKAKIAFP
ncbi:glutaminyl-tRNA synthase (glutamine-hydrolyzing) subunit A [Candidatus Woesebacteria bacterium RBG_16_34_12]|uniref:Glutamyl-tRNA(Gln) amidotransferase subunit A n=1 Tax=Candidatus Woesebacteria bacterium RBG_16_34_12 TaxID=1802480 RepID=A0A1F7XBP0_9BACT|nr:MAG: glutaminyl-tRNA synthase (glutamine-hydrolyzing) subunit A [Candidatus Woesebacteria bacterium RBG_16_34_12]